MDSEASRASIFDTLRRTSFFSSIRGGGLQQSLPVSNAQKEGGLRRRLSSLSLKIQESSSSSAAWSFRRSKSMSAMGEQAGSSLRKWWDWGWAWVMSKKPSFATDLEMSEEAATLLGAHNRGRWRHVFYKIRSEFRRIMGPGQLPVTQPFRYDSFSYAQNFDDGKMPESRPILVN